MLLMKEYLCNGTPTDEDIKDAMFISKTDSCAVKLYWSKLLPCDRFICVIHTMSFEMCKKQILEVY